MQIKGLHQAALAVPLKDFAFRGWAMGLGLRDLEVRGLRVWVFRDALNPKPPKA